MLSAGRVYLPSLLARVTIPLLLGHDAIDRTDDELVVAIRKLVPFFSRG